MDPILVNRGRMGLDHAMRPAHVSYPLVLILFFKLLGCSTLGSFDADPTPEKSFRPQSAVFLDPYERVWRAAQLALQDYPIRINNMVKGVIETDLIKGAEAWRPAHQKRPNPSGLRYRLQVRVLRGRNRNRPTVKVSVFKKNQIQRDFFAGRKAIPSDGLEEKVVLYRVGRELQIERAIERLAKQSQKSRR